MTKRVMINKFMRETGADKKTASTALRSIDWEEAIKKIQEERNESNEDSN